MNDSSDCNSHAWVGANARNTCKRLLLASALIFQPMLAFSDAERLYDIPLPLDTNRKSVALDIIQNGHRASIATLLNAPSIEPVLEFYRNTWDSGQAEVPGYIEDRAGEWHIISQVDNGWNKVVQIRKTGQGTEAFISVLELEPKKGWANTRALPPGGVLVSSTSGEEFGKPTQTDIVYSKRRDGEVAGFYRNHFKTSEWRIVSDRNIDGSTVLLMHHKQGQAEVVVTQALGGSVAVINQVGSK